MRALGAALPAPVEPVEAAGWNGDALEAQCFAFLAARVSAGLPLTFPGNDRSTCSDLGRCDCSTLTAGPSRSAG